jgi:hypothetical protein
MLDITDERGREWVQAHPEQFGGLPLAPLEACTDATGHPEVFITQPSAGTAVQGVVPVVGTVVLPNFDHYEAQYGIGGNPQGWGWISGPHLAQVRNGVLTSWDTTHLSPGLYTLRIRAFTTQQHPVEARVQVQVAAPTATSTSLPSPSPQATPTPWPSSTPATVPTPAATATPAATEMPSPSPLAVTPTESTEDITPSPSPVSETTSTGEQVPTPTP